MGVMVVGVLLHLDGKGFETRREFSRAAWEKWLSDLKLSPGGRSV